MITICIWDVWSFNYTFSFSNHPDSNDSIKPKWNKILNFNIFDTVWNRTYVIDDMVQFGEEIFCVNRESVYTLDKKNHRLVPCINGLNILNDIDDAATRLSIHKNKLYVALLDHGIYQYDVKKKSWNRMKTGMLETDTTFFDLISCNGALYAPAHDNGLYALKDKKQEWEKVKGENAYGILECACIDSVLWVGTIANELYVLSPISGQLRKFKQFKEPEWVEKSMIGAGITGMMNKGDTLYVGVHVSGIFKSPDGGKTWDKNRIKFVLGPTMMKDGFLLMSDNWGYRNGLFILDPETDEFHKIELGLGDVTVEFMKCIGDTFYLATRNSLYSMPWVDFKKFYLPEKP